MTPVITLRDVIDSDVPLFFAHQNEPGAAEMAAFATRDHDAFMAHWEKIRADETCTLRAVLLGGQVVGHVGSFNFMDQREVAYWIARDHWGKGIATAALEALLAEETKRPLHARVARTNVGSRRVLEKCGFVECGSERLEQEGEEIVELIMKLE